MYTRGVEIFWLGPQDTRAYTTLATHLLNHNAFLSYSGLMPESWYTPGYPFFLAIIFALFKSWVPAIIIQNIIASCSAILVYQIGKKYISEPAGFVGVLLFALEPTNAYISNFLWSETLFLFLFLIFILSFMEFLTTKDNPAWRHIVIASLSLSAAIYVRSIAFYLPIIFGALFIGALLTKQRIINRNKLVPFAGFLLIVALLVTPWLVRNKALFNRWSISSAGSVMLYFYDAVPFAYMRNADSPIAYMIGAEEVSEPENDIPLIPFTSEFHYTGTGGLRQEKYLLSEAKKIILQHPIQYTAFHTTSGFGGMFLQDSWRSIVRRLDYTPEISGVTRALANFDINALQKTISIDVALWIFVGIAGHLFFFLTTICFLVGCMSLFRDPKLFGMLAIMIVIYFTMLTGPAAYRERYRYPITPFVFLLAAQGALYARSSMRPKIYNFFNHTNHLKQNAERKTL